MSYQAELSFLQRLLEKYRLQCLCFSRDEAPEIDLGLRRMLGLSAPHNALLQEGQENTIYFVTDEFECCYNGFILPGGERAFRIGPYLKREMQETDIMALLERYQLPAALFGALRQYYSMLPLVASEGIMLAALNALGEAMWGTSGAFAFEYLQSSEPPLPLPRTDSRDGSETEAMRVKMVEKRYEGERHLMHAVEHGLNHQAQLIISQWRMDAFEQRCADPIRNMRNYGIILNTLLRKAAENGHVHPLHIDQLSSSIARKIETFSRTEDFSELVKQMVHKYCLLVRNHSMQHYSRLVQHVILHIDTDLTADLSLKSHAVRFNVNASYLSTLFKKETGVTLTEYVNRARIDHAIFLLNATDMQIQTIAQYCGIPDVNYFTKLFKKLIGKTPKEYRMLTRGMQADH